MSPRYGFGCAHIILGAAAEPYLKIVGGGGPIEAPVKDMPPTILMGALLF